MKDNVLEFLQKQSQRETLRFISCGSIDDGKSTLIGRLLYDSNSLFEDQIKALSKDSIKHGTQDNELDYSLLLDGLSAEREEKITIDVAYRYFGSPTRRFIVADTPGHEQFTRNMITAASTANAAVILVNASTGIQNQTLRHIYLCDIMGVNNLVIAVNKMDLVGYREDQFRLLTEDLNEYISNISDQKPTSIPVSAINGENVGTASDKMDWYSGPTVLGCLESIPVSGPNIEQDFCFPVQWVNRPNSSFRGYSGRVASGTVKIGDKVSVSRSGEIATIDKLILSKMSYDCVIAGQSITMTLDREIEISRGDILGHEMSAWKQADHFDVELIWMSKTRGFTGREYRVKLSSQESKARITRIKSILDLNKLTRLAATELNCNDIANVQMATTRPLTFSKYENNQELGSLILIDEFSNETIAAGLIRNDLRRSSNTHRYNLGISKSIRQASNGHVGKVIWFTGLSGSGKSTLANGLEIKLHEAGIKTYLIDGDNIRNGLNKDLGFSEADRIENIRRIAETAKLFLDAGLVVLTASISPFRAERDYARSIFEADEFIEVYVNTDLSTAETRDPKGLYHKARNGELPNFTGIDSPYEQPLNPDVTVSTDTTVEESVDYLLGELGKLGISAEASNN